MDFVYGEYDGQPFQTPDDLFAPNSVVEFILQHGDKALEAMDKSDSNGESDLIDALIKAGLLERDEATGKLQLTPRMLRGIEHKSLLDIFDGLRRGSREGHQTLDKGRSDERTEGTRPYEYGDALSDLDAGQTMRNAVHRQRTARGDTGRPTLPIHINSHDFEVHVTEGQSDVALCLLLDLSGSMMRWGRFYHAKRVALGMAALMRSRFPQDTIDCVGFYSTASRIAERDLPLVMPKPVTVYDGHVRLRVPLQEAMRDPRVVPQHFTNLQLGLRVARQTLARRGAANKQIFVVTDGQPTAHCETNHAGVEMLYLLYPPGERTSTATLTEALRCHQQGIRIASFALIEDYWGMDWVGFIDRMTRLTRGTAYYCSGEDLASTVVESYLNGKRRKSFVA